MHAEWCGAMLCGVMVVRCCVVWCDVVRCCVVGCGVVLCCVVWCDAIALHDNCIKKGPYAPFLI